MAVNVSTAKFWCTGLGNELCALSSDADWPATHMCTTPCRAAAATLPGWGRARPPAFVVASPDHRRPPSPLQIRESQRTRAPGTRAGKTALTAHPALCEPTDWCLYFPEREVASNPAIVCSLSGSIRWCTHSISTLSLLTCNGDALSRGPVPWVPRRCQHPGFVSAVEISVEVLIKLSTSPYVILSPSSSLSCTYPQRRVHSSFLPDIKLYNIISQPPRQQYILIIVLLSTTSLSGLYLSSHLNLPSPDLNHHSGQASLTSLRCTPHLILSPLIWTDISSYLALRTSSYLQLPSDCRAHSISSWLA